MLSPISRPFRSISNAVGDLVGGAAHGNIVAHHVEHATALQAGRDQLVQEMHRHVHAHQRVLAEAHEIHMDGEVAHGVELDVARDHAGLGAVQVEHEYGALEMAGLDLLGNRLGFQRDALGLFV